MNSFQQLLVYLHVFLQACMELDRSRGSQTHCGGTEIQPSSLAPGVSFILHYCLPMYNYSNFLYKAIKIFRIALGYWVLVVKKFVLNLDWVSEKVYHLMTIVIRLFVCNLAVHISIQWRTQGQANSSRGTHILVDCEVVYFPKFGRNYM